MQMSKNQRGHQMRPAVVWFLGFPLVANLKKVHFAFIPVLGGRGRIRTCDPALIKRML